MLDTIRLVLPGFGMPVGFDDEKWKSCSGTYKGIFNEKYRLLTEKLDPKLAHVRCVYNHTRHEITLEASLPRVAFGHNIVTLRPAELPLVVELLDYVVQSWGLTDFHGMRLCDVPSVTAWRVRRVDLVFDYRSKRIPRAAVLRGLLNLQPSGRLTAVRINNQTAYFKTAGKRKRVELVIYDKQREAKKQYPQDAQLANGMIRLEVRLFGQDTIRKAFGLGAHPTLAKIAVPRAIVRVIRKRLARLDVRPGLESIITGFDVLKDRVGAKARRLWQYAQARSNSSRREIVEHWNISAETARRYERELRSAGLFPAVVATQGVVEDLLAQLTALAPEHEVVQRPSASDADNGDVACA